MSTKLPSEKSRLSDQEPIPLGQTRLPVVVLPDERTPADIIGDALHHDLAIVEHVQGVVKPDKELVVLSNSGAPSSDNEDEEEPMVVTEETIID